MLKTLAGKLTALIIISILLSAGLSWIFATRGMRAEIDNIITADLAGDVDALEELINSRSEEYANDAPISQDVLARWSELLEVRITLIDGKGNVLADSSVEREDIGSMDNHAERPEVRDAFLKGLGIDRRYSETTGVPYLYYAASIHIKGKTDPIVIRCSLPLARYYDILNQATKNILLTHLVSGIMALAAGIVGVRRVTRPILELITASRAKSDGSRSYPTGGSLEIEELSRALKEGAEAQARMMGELQDERNQLMTVVQSAPCGLMLVGPDGRMSCANGALAPLLRDLPERLEGADAEAALRAPELIDLISKGRSGEYRETSFTFRQGGGERYYNVRALPAGQNETLLVLDDVTERKKIEEARKSFVADAGHELRTPLTSISVAAELLSGMTESTAQERMQYIEEIMRQRERMTVLVDNLLLLSKLESGAPSSASRNFDLSDITREQIDESRKNPKASSITWETDIPEKLVYYGRPDELGRSISNLLDNAVKYTHRRYRGEPGGNISVRLIEEDGACVLKVRDNGVGIPCEDAGRIFGRFERIERDRARDGKDTGGYGLGLAIVKTAVESHGGNVTLKSSDGSTEFAVRLPLSA